MRSNPRNRAYRGSSYPGAQRPGEIHRSREAAVGTDHGFPGAENPGPYAIPATWTFTMDAHSETRYHVHGQTQPDDTGKRSAVKAARYVWRGALGKGQQRTSLGAYPTRKKVQLCERLVGYDRFVGERASAATDRTLSGATTVPSTVSNRGCYCYRKNATGKRCGMCMMRAKTPREPPPTVRDPRLSRSSKN